jgi:hypothetical protein
MASSFSEHFGALLREQNQSAPEDAQHAIVLELAELHRVAQENARKIQEQSALRFHLHQWCLVLSGQLARLARWVG